MGVRNAQLAPIATTIKNAFTSYPKLRAISYDIGAIITAVAALLIISETAIVITRIIIKIHAWPRLGARLDILDAIKPLSPVDCMAIPIGIIAASITIIGHSTDL